MSKVSIFGNMFTTIKSFYSSFSFAALLVDPQILSLVLLATQGSTQYIVQPLEKLTCTVYQLDSLIVQFLDNLTHTVQLFKSYKYTVQLFESGHCEMRVP